MLTTIAATFALACMPYRPPPPLPPVTVTCEGTDQVRRNHDGIEVSRVSNACTVVRCEGDDRVRRTFEGSQVSRATNACTIARCEGWDFVVRTNDGQTLTRLSSAQRCIPTPVQYDPLRYGLSYR